MGLVNGPGNSDELRSMEAKLNDDVRAFERRRKFLIRWQVDAVVMSLVTKLATNALRLSPHERKNRLFLAALAISGSVTNAAESLGMAPIRQS